MPNTKYLAIIVLVLILSNIISAQKMTQDEKIKLIDMQIEQAESAKSTGMWMLLGGLGVEVIGWALYDPIGSLDGWNYEAPDNTITWILIFGGSLTAIWGSYKWWSAAQEVSLLKTKRFDISFSPTIIPTTDRKFAYGIGINIQF